MPRPKPRKAFARLFNFCVHTGQSLLVKLTALQR